MIIGNPILLGGGGGGLDITVVGGTTRPENPKENTIWVYTDVSIGATYLTPNAPTNPEVGDVWVNTTNNSNDTDASTNILRVSDDPYLEINVLNISQWDGTKWVERGRSAIYANNAWTTMTLYMLNQGVIAEGFTIDGGYGTTSTLGDAITAKTTVNYDSASGYAYVEMSAGCNGRVAMQFSPAIDMTNYTKLRAKGRAFTSYDGTGTDRRTVYVGCSAISLSDSVAPSILELTDKGQQTTGEVDAKYYSDFDLTVDLSDVTGENYIAVCADFIRNKETLDLYLQTVVLTA